MDIANSLNDYFVSVFEDADVHEQLSILNVNKATGVDQVHPYVLKACSKSLSQPLSIIFKKSYYSGVIPDEWLKANIIPLFKKGNKLEPTNYRPVSLTSIFCKVMEKMIRAVMMNHLMSNKLLQVSSMVLWMVKIVVQIY